MAKIRNRFPRSYFQSQPETSGVGEQELTRADNRRATNSAEENSGPQGSGSEPRPEYRNPYTQTNNPFTVGTNSIRVLPENSRRTYLIVQNKSGDVMFMTFGESATIYGGIRIPAGGSYELIGGASGGSHCPKDSVNILGGSADLIGVASEGVIN